MSDLERGWHDDPEDPTSVRYWDGEAWGNRAPRPTETPKPQSTWKGARIVAFGILIAAATIFAIYQWTAPSEAECATDALLYNLGSGPAPSSRC